MMNLVAVAGLFVLVTCLAIQLPSKSGSSSMTIQYNKQYPLTTPVKTDQVIKYRIGIVTDLDEDSKARDGKSWLSYYKKGHVSWNTKSDEISIVWDSEVPLKSGYSMAGRGMELSELIVFDGKLLAVDDRTGIVFIIKDNNEVVAWVVLSDGDGHSPKGFKSEWAAVKDETLYVGSLGKEWTTSKGDYVNLNPMWVKTVSTSGHVTHLNWTDNYIALRKVLGIEFPGYVIHESGVWSDVHQKWFFLPRRCSRLKYDDETDEKMGTNILLTTDVNFTNVKVTYIGNIVPTHGFSSFKFLPGSKDRIIVALKSEEVKGKQSSYIMAFTIEGKILVPETKIGNYKFEGLEFI